MNKNSKSFWMYTIILFTVALVLVLLSLAMTDYKKANKNYESRVQSLQNENAQLAEAKVKNEMTIAGLEEKNRQLTTELDSNRNAAEIYANAVEAIYIADAQCARGDYRDAKATLDTVDASILKEKIKGRYDKVKADIDRNID